MPGSSLSLRPFSGFRCPPASFSGSLPSVAPLCLVVFFFSLPLLCRCLGSCFASSWCRVFFSFCPLHGPLFLFFGPSALLVPVSVSCGGGPLRFFGLWPFFFAGLRFSVPSAFWGGWVFPFLPFPFLVPGRRFFFCGPVLVWVGRGFCLPCSLGLACLAFGPWGFVLEFCRFSRFPAPVFSLFLCCPPSFSFSLAL